MISPPVQLPCPDEADLRHFLDDSLPVDSAASVEAHVELCQRCQVRLESITTDPTLLLTHQAPRRLCHHPGDGFLHELRSAATLAEPPAAALPEVAGYQLLRELGRGGMGIVYLARQQRLARLVALKLVHAAAGSNAHHRFRREAEAAARLQHPHIVQIHEVGEAGGWPYLALEYVDGPTLDASLRRSPRLPREAAELLELLARTMHVAHSAGIIHRDLKPGNILLTAEGKPKVTDFGLAKLLDSTADAVSRSGQLLGTPSYVAPEQVAGSGVGGEVSPAADVYALGAILYETLTGTPPFRAALPVDTLLQVLHQDPLPPSRLQPQVPRDLETICLTCLNKSPGKRYASAEALADDLRRYLDGRPVKARPLGLLGRSVRWVRRNPAASVLVAVVTLATVGAASGLAWLWQEAEARAALEARAHRTVRRQAVDLAVDRSLQMCEQGEVARGMVGLAETAAGLSAEDADLEWVIRANLDAWRHYVVAHRRTLTHPDDVLFAQFTGDGGTLVTACQDGSIRFWEQRSGEPVGPALRHGSKLAAVAVDPRGGKLVTAGRDGRALLWEIPSGKTLGQPLRHEGPLTSVVFSPDGQTVLSGSEDGTARLWNSLTGAPLGNPMTHGASVSAVAFSGDGKRVLVGGADGIARLWDAATTTALAVAAKHGSAVGHLAVSPDGMHYATGSATNLIGSAPPTPESPRVHSIRFASPVTCLAYEPHGDYLAIGAGGLENNLGVQILRLNHHPVVSRLIPFEGSVQSLAVSPNCRQVLAAGNHWRATLWLEPFERQMSLRLEHEGVVRSAAFGPDYSRIVTISGKAAHLWDVPPEPQADLRLAQTSVTRLRAAGNLAVAVSGKVVRGWDLAGRKPLGPTWPLPGLHAAWDDARRVWVADGKRVSARELSSGKAQGPSFSCPQPVSALTIRPADQVLAVADSRPAIQLHDGTTGKALGAPLSTPEPVQILAFSPSGGRLAAAGPDRLVRLWRQPDANESPTTLEHRSSVRSLAFSPCGNRLAVSCKDKTVQVWDLERGEAASPLMILPEVVIRLAWHPDGRLLCVSCLDGTARFWDTLTGKPVGPPLLWRVYSIAFTPDGEHLLTGAENLDVQSWRVPRPVAAQGSDLPAWVRTAIGDSDR